MHWPRTVTDTCLTADNQPVEPAELGRKVDHLQHRLDAEEADCGRGRHQVRDAPPRLDPVFRGRAEPDVRSAVGPIGGQHARDILRSFREQNQLTAGVAG